MSVEKTIKYYKTVNGKEPFYEWLLSLRDKIIRARINRRLERVALGNYGDCLVVIKVHKLKI